MSPEAPPDSQELLRRLQQGEAAFLASLLERHLPRLRAFVRLRVDASVRAQESDSDLVQTVCCEVLQNAHQFQFLGEERFRAWLFQTALNQIRDRARYNHAERRNPAARDPERSASDLSDSYCRVHTASQAAIAQETAEALERAFDLLSEDHRRVITLSRIVGLSHAELAVEMGRSEDAVRVLLSRALVAYIAAMDRVQGKR
ncbi:MAG: sigma-70 family RNA polymerase sigma factor [Planctomycetes bacterium]|nr:sigma-70 family RNA polymerase sigma factor [Planctomycetota bacterium]